MNEVPHAYREWNPGRADRPVQHDLVIKSWDKDKFAVLLYGKSGTGKTRTACEYIRQHFPKRHYYNLMSSWARQVSKRAFDGTLDDWLIPMTDYDRLEEIEKEDEFFDCVFLDDIDKAKFTPSVARTFLELLEARIAGTCQILLTTQLVGDQLYEKILNDSKADKEFDERGECATAEAIVRRLGDPSIFYAVDFTPEFRPRQNAGPLPMEGNA